jgi:hypothetical protein
MRQPLSGAFSAITSNTAAAAAAAAALQAPAHLFHMIHTQVISSCSFIANFSIARHVSHDPSSCLATISGSMAPLSHPRWIVDAVSGRQQQQASAAAAAPAHDMHVTASLFSLVSCSWGR